MNRLNSIKKEIVITHPGPINRGVELNSDVIDSGKTVILDQVENGVAVRMAVMYLLASKLWAVILLEYFSKKTLI